MRAELHAQHGASSELDVALAGGAVVRRDHKLYRQKDAP
jgi:hypothetical protein